MTKVGGFYAEIIMNNKYKPSKYNLLIPLTDNRILAYNGIASTLAVWDNKDENVYNHVANDATGSIDNFSQNQNEIISNLVKGSFIVDVDVDETKNLREKFRMNRFYKNAMTLTIAPTVACNFACDYCYQGEHDSSEKMMLNETFQKIIDYIASKSNTLKFLHIAWYGGEPLLQPDVIYNMSEKIINLCKENNIFYSASIVTNGYYFTREVAEKLQQYKVSVVQITLDGDKKSHDERRIRKDGSPSFDTIINNIQNSIDSGININIRVNIDSRNADRIEYLLNNLEELGLNNRKNLSVYFAAVDICSKECLRVVDKIMPIEQYSKLEIKLLKIANKKGLSAAPFPSIMHSMCAAIKPNGFVILPNGDVHKCWNTVSDPSFKVCAVEEMAEVENMPLQKAWLKWSPFDIPECQNCKILPNCTGACANLAFQEESTPCLSLKYNIKDKLIMYAISKNAITYEDIPTNNDSLLVFK